MAIAPRSLHALVALCSATVLCALLATSMVTSAPVAFKPAAPPMAHRGVSSDEIPASLRQVASEMLGRTNVRYWLRLVAGGFEGINPAQRLRLRSEASGIELTDQGSRRVRLTLARATTQSSRLDLSHVVARLDENRLVYDTGQVQQSFVNGPSGVEQRFSIRAPPGGVAGQVELVIAVAGARGVPSPDGTSALLKAGNGSTLRYGGLAAHDSRGRPLPAQIRVERGQLILDVQTRGARFPITVDPLLSPYTMLTGPAGATSAFGSSTAISSDGNTVAIGGESDGGGSGAVWIFSRSGSSWAQQGSKLTPRVGGPTSGSRGVEHFGAEVAISADGNTVLVGDGRFGGLLAAWVFVRVNGVWREEGSPLSPRLRKQGYASGSENIALSADGRTAALNSNFESTGLTWVYAFSHGRWRQEGRPLRALDALALSASGRALLIGTHFYLRSGRRWRASGGLPLHGYVRAALSADAMTAAVGESSQGYTLIFKRRKGRWVKVAQLSSPHPEPQLDFAERVLLSADGKTALIAASPRAESSTEKPIAYIFTNALGDSWAPTATLRINQPWNAALSADGATIVAPPLLREVAERTESSGGPAQVFVRAGNVWLEQALLAPSDAMGVNRGGFGENFALSADASTALISEGAGAAWIFTRAGASWTRRAYLHVEGITGGGSLVALSSDGNTAVLAGPSAPGPVAAWVFTRSGGNWSSRSTPLYATGIGPLPPGAAPAQGSFASSVAVSADGAVVVVGGAWDSGRTGAVWVFTRSGNSWTQQGPKLTPRSPSPEERFGDSVSLSADGSVALIGAVGDRQRPPEGSPAEGAAYVFTRSGTAWTQTAKLISEFNRWEPLREQGTAVALSADGNTALLGAHRAAVVFVKTAAGWQMHHPPLKQFARSYGFYNGTPAFGDVIALASGGSRAVIGGIPEGGCGKYDDEPCSAASVVWAFERVGEEWVRQPLPLAGDRSFGDNAALSANGETALIGGATPGFEPGGAVFVSQLSAPPRGGFVIEPTHVGYEGAVELALWSQSRATFKAIAHVTSPATQHIGRSACTRSRRVNHAATKRGCSPAPAVYGTASAKGIENIGIEIVPRPAIRRHIERHRHVHLTITITERPSPPAAPSSQRVELNLTYRTPPPTEF